MTKKEFKAFVEEALEWNGAYFRTNEEEEEPGGILYVEDDELVFNFAARRFVGTLLCWRGGQYMVGRGCYGRAIGKQTVLARFFSQYTSCANPQQQAAERCHRQSCTQASSKHRQPQSALLLTRAHVSLTSRPLPRSL